MYRHEVFVSYNFAGVRHFRDTTRPSGFILSEEIAQTAALVDWASDTRPASGLILPDSLIPQIPELPSKRIDCEDLPELVRSGTEIWQELIATMGGTTLRVTLAHAENRQPTDTIRDSGFIIPNDGNIPEFVSYPAHPDEMTALETMVHQVNIALSNDKPVPGNYL